jgi:hypothetical protein
MAENVPIVDQAGATQQIATDLVVDSALGTAQVQFTKLMDGTIGGTSKAVVGSGGQLQTSDVDARRLSESTFLQNYAAAMTLLDPLRGFEIR